MQKTKIQYLRILIAGAFLISLVVLISITINRKNLLKVSVIRPQRQTPAEIVQITDLNSIPNFIDLQKEESILWENQTENKTIQIVSRQFSSPHLSPEEMFQVKFVVGGEYMLEYRGVTPEASYTKITVN